VSDVNNFLTGVGLFNNSALNIPSDSFWLIIAGGLHGTGTQLAIDLWNNEPMKMRHCASQNWGAWGDANVGLANYLPLSGGTATGNITVSKNGEDAGIRAKETSNGTEIALEASASGRIGLFDYGNVQWMLCRDTDGKLKVSDATHSFVPLLHTGNKPSGTYTGNGTIDSRYFQINSVGKTLMIWSVNGVCFINQTNAVLIGADGSVTWSKEGINYNGNTLGFYSTSPVLNKSGDTYYYYAI